MPVSQPPNILLITSDQQHWNTLGLNNPEIHTPHLDRLAKRGCLFERAYCPNPTCTPTRASMITGCYPSQHGAYSLGTKLMEDRPTVGAALSAAGYRTSLVGKAHFQPLRSSSIHPSLESYPVLRDLDFWRDFDQPFYGFDHVELARNHTDETHVGQHYALWMEERGFTEWREHFQNTWQEFKFGETANSPQHGTWTLPEEYHYNTWIAERTNKLLQEATEANEPFFHWASFFDPHPPYLIPEPWDRMYDPARLTVPQLQPGEHNDNPEHFRKTQQVRPDFSDWEEPGGNEMHGCCSHLQDRESLARDIAIYYGMISCMDKYIGRILDKVDRLGIADHTLIVFTSDHGHFFGHHGLNAKGPFHYEDLIKVPLIAAWSGHITPDSHSTDIQSLVDLAPTFLGAANVPAPSSMTGLDQTASWLGRTPPPRDHALIENRHQPTTLYAKTYVNSRYKLTTYRGREYGELFDLEVDPAETHNLWNEPAYASLKSDLLMRFLHAEFTKEVTPMNRVSPA